MAITYFGSASNPADNGTSAATTVAVTPPASMVTGDLVIFMAYQRGTATTSISETSGQTWTSQRSIPGSPGPTLAGGLFWCIYNGTWGADPSVLFSAGTNTNVVMHVFRPSLSSNLWAFEPTTSGLFAGSFTGGSAPSSPFTVSITTWGTTINASTISLAIWITDDDNTWGSLSGSGWSVTGTAQYRNTSGSDVSSSYAHNIMTSTGTPADVSKNQATLGGDPFVIGKFIWYEYTPAPARTPRPTSVGHPFII